MKKNGKCRIARIVAISLSIVLSSCNNSYDALVTDNIPVRTNVETASGEHKAIRAFESFLNRINTEVGTRRNAECKVLKVEQKTTAVYKDNLPNTRAIELSLPVYELTLQNEDKATGFAVVVDTPAECQVMAYAPIGSIADTIYNEGLASFFRELSFYTEVAMERRKNTVSTTRADIWQSNWEDFYSYQVINSKEYVRDLNQYEVDHDAPGYPYSVVDYSTTIGQVIPAQWNQTSPYNNNVPVYVTGTNERVKIGCLPVAIGQVMSYYKNNNKYNWELLTRTQTIQNNTSAAIEVAKLLRDISIEAGTNFYPNENTAGTNVERVESTIKSFGLNVCRKDLYSASCMDSITNNLLKNHPVLIVGNNNKTVGLESHIWIIDAMITQKWWYYYAEEVHSNYPPYTRYVVSRDRYEGRFNHCNWGWGGYSNGWYHSFYPIYVDGHQACFAYNKIIFTQIYPL